MIDKKDTKTLDLPVLPKKRGRPSTGKALTAAQRKQRQRAKDWAITANGIGTMDFKEMTTTGLLEQLASAVATQNHELAKSLAAELVKRSKPGIVKKVTVTEKSVKKPVKPGTAKKVTVTKKTSSKKVPAIKVGKPPKHIKASDIHPGVGLWQ